MIKHSSGRRYQFTGKILGTIIGGFMGPLGIPFGLAIGALVDHVFQERRRWNQLLSLFTVVDNPKKQMTSDERRTLVLDHLSYQDALAAAAAPLISLRLLKSGFMHMDSIRKETDTVFGRRVGQISGQLADYLLEYKDHVEQALILPALGLLNDRLLPEHIQQLAVLLSCSDTAATLEEIWEYIEADDESADKHENEQAAGDTSNSGSVMDAATAYRILGLSPRADERQIREAYRRLAVQFHPDAVAGFDEERQQQSADAFHRIHSAYELLRSMRA